MPNVQPRTLEVEHILGVGADVKKAAARSPYFQVHDPADPHRIIKEVKVSEEIEATPAFPEVGLILRVPFLGIGSAEMYIVGQSNGSRPVEAPGYYPEAHRGSRRQG